MGVDGDGATTILGLCAPGTLRAWDADIAGEMRAALRNGHCDIFRARDSPDFKVDLKVELRKAALISARPGLAQHETTAGVECVDSLASQKASVDVQFFDTAVASDIREQRLRGHSVGAVGRLDQRRDDNAVRLGNLAFIPVEEL